MTARFALLLGVLCLAPAAFASEVDPKPRAGAPGAPKDPPKPPAAPLSEEDLAVLRDLELLENLDESSDLELLQELTVER